MNELSKYDRRQCMIEAMASQYAQKGWVEILQQENIDIILDALQSAQARDRRADEWIPVTPETMPVSGAHVLLTCERRPGGERYVCDGFYAASKSIVCGCDCDCDTEYDDETDEVYLPEGFYEVIKHWEDFSSIVIDAHVTNWMPLPTPPKGETI